LIAELDGFSTVEHLTIKISQGKSTQIDVVLSPAIEETITVTQESPLLDEVKLLFGLIADALHLDKIPSGRDVGAIATRAAGVSADRVDVGGSESGELTRLLGAGSEVGENTLLLDGIVATDPVDAGGSLLPGYGFDWLREAAVTTGGTGARLDLGWTLPRRREPGSERSSLAHRQVGADRRSEEQGRLHSRNSRMRSLSGGKPRYPVRREASPGARRVVDIHDRTAARARGAGPGGRAADVLAFRYGREPPTVQPESAGSVGAPNVHAAAGARTVPARGRSSRSAGSDPLGAHRRSPGAGDAG
jgi:hypothetical protein